MKTLAGAIAAALFVATGVQAANNPTKEAVVRLLRDAAKRQRLMHQVRVRDDESMLVALRMAMRNPTCALR